MAMTKHREPNMVKWVGVRPGHNGIQVLASDSADDATVIVYTVPADSLLLIFSVFCVHTYRTAVGAAHLAIYDDVPAIFHYLARGRSDVARHWNIAYGLTIPIEVPEDYSIRIASNAAGSPCYGGITGILVPV